jgi:hypothetical protein
VRTGHGLVPVNRDMDHSDLPRRQRPQRDPVLAPYEGGGPYDEYPPYDEYAPYDDGPWPVSTSGASPTTEMGGGGLLAGAVTGLIGAAVALGTANLAAAFVRRQASPIIAVEDLSGNGKIMPLLGPYVMLALIAIVIGMVAWRRGQAGAGIGLFGLFGLFGAFVTLTRPGSHVTDAIPSLAGGIAAIAAAAWLIRAGTRRTGYESPAPESLGDESPAYEPLRSRSPAYESLLSGSPTHESPAYRTGWTA